MPFARVLREPNCTGPDPVYSIAMDVGRAEDREGTASTYDAFRHRDVCERQAGQRAVRSQGHVHARRSALRMVNPRTV